MDEEDLYCDGCGEHFDNSFEMVDHHLEDGEIEDHHQDIQDITIDTHSIIDRPRLRQVVQEETIIMIGIDLEAPHLDTETEMTGTDHDHQEEIEIDIPHPETETTHLEIEITHLEIETTHLEEEIHIRETDHHIEAINLLLGVDHHPPTEADALYVTKVIEH